MRLYEGLRIPEGKGITAIVGGGGKTTLLYFLGRELAADGKKVVILTTTKMFPVPEDVALTVSKAAELEERWTPGRLLCLGTVGPVGKLEHPGDEEVRKAAAWADRVLAEADGAKHYPAKAPAEGEPVIPEGTDSLIAVAGLDAVGLPIAEGCFRKERAAALLGCGEGDLLTPSQLAFLLTSSEGQRKDLPEEASFSVVLNKADTEEKKTEGRKIGNLIRSDQPDTPVFLTRLLKEEYVEV